MVDYEVGQELPYHEGKMRLRVRVLEDNSNEKSESYRLGITEVIKGHPFVKPEVGRLFTFNKSRDSPRSGDTFGLTELTETI